ncbi:hypothetical protein [Mucilaginibacter sp. NFX135]|uniref:hypothetical protein n=1 Tax=Mucilaginibacter sp. NFX135 TaxID=3402687 RepID=UPI003AFB7F2E
MKNLKLKALGLGVAEVLTRTQLKNVTGGASGPTCSINQGGCATSITCAGGEICRCTENPCWCGCRG